MDNGSRPRAVFAIYKPNLSAVSTCDLLSECESDTAAFRLSRVEGDEEILGVGNAQAAVFDYDHDIRLCDAPSDAHRLGAIGQ